MTTIRIRRACVSIGAVLLTLLVCSMQAGFAQDDDAEWDVRVYRVTDLILPRPDYPYDGAEIPTTGRSLGSSDVSGSAITGGFGGGGFGGGIGGGGFGGGGEGFFQVTDEFGFAMGGGGLGPMGSQLPSEETGSRFSMDDLINAIQLTIEPESWVDMGGDAVCTPLGGMLIVKQTAPVHLQIDALLTAIRAEGGSVQTVTLQAHWLLLSGAELDQLVDGSKHVPARVNREMLEALSGDRPGYQGRITCFTDQTVHIVSGQRRSTVLSAIPVVSATAIGLQPVISLPNIGVLLEAKPMLLSGEKASVLNLVSTVTSTRDVTEPIELVSRGDGADSTLKLDRLSLDTQRLATTVRMPLGQPVLVGGLTVVSETGANDQQPQNGQLYLVVELTADPGEE